MSFKTEHNTFVSTNKAAFAAFSAVADEALSTREKWQLRLVEAGIAPEDYRVFALHWVFAKTGTAPRMGQRGWTYDGSERHMLEDIIKALKGQTDAKLAARKAARKGAKAIEVSPEAIKAAKALLKACGGDAKAAVAAIEAAK